MDRSALKSVQVYENRPAGRDCLKLSCDIDRRNRTREGKVVRSTYLGHSCSADTCVLYMATSLWPINYEERFCDSIEFPWQNEIASEHNKTFARRRFVCFGLQSYPLRIVNGLVLRHVTNEIVVAIWAHLRGRMLGMHLFENRMNRDTHRFSIFIFWLI